MRKLRVTTLKPGERGEIYYSSGGYASQAQKNEDGSVTKILLHREAMEKHLGRPLASGENVHHLNGDRGDFRIENLELWNTSQPSGQRVPDKVRWALALIEQYPEVVASIQNQREDSQ